MRYLSFCFFLFLISSIPAGAQESSEKKSLLEQRAVRVYIPSSDEEQVIYLKQHQKATVFVYLSSLGDPLDKYMVSIVSNTDNRLIANILSGPEGEVVFRKIEAGEYTVFVNRRVIRDEMMSSVKVADVRIKAVP